MTVFLRNSRWFVAALGAALFLGVGNSHPHAGPPLVALIPHPRLLVVNPSCRLSVSAAHPLTIPARIDPGGVDLLGERLQALGLPEPLVSSAPVVHVQQVRGAVEHYILDVGPGAIRIGAASRAGEMDALATLAQLVGQGGSRAAIPCVHVEDEPALAWRFLSDDVSRGPLPTMAYFQSRIRRLASYKFNGYSIYLENIVIRPGHEAETRADGITKKELTQLAQLCARYHMAFVPEQESFAHLAALLTPDRYRGVRENDFGDMISPAAPQTYAMLGDLFRSEFAGVPDIRWIHIGGDETFELGSGRSAGLVKRLGYAMVYAQHITRVAQIVKGLGARPLVWGDAIRRYPQILREIPKWTIVVPFDYDVERSYEPFIAPILQAGFSLLVAPSVANFGRFFPDLPQATGNIRGFVAAAKRHKVLGMFVTTWIGARDELYDATWYPAAFAAAQAWEQTNQGLPAFCARFAELTFGSVSACAAFADFARLEDDFRTALPSDSSLSLWRADWRVPYFAHRVHLAPGTLSRLTAHTVALRTGVARLPADRDPHMVRTMQIAALRYSILLALLRGERPNPELVQRAEQMHVAEWRYENRRLSAADEITDRYAALLPAARSNGASSIALPAIDIAPAASEVPAIQAWLAAREPRAASPSFLLADPAPYVASSSGLDPQVVTQILPRVKALGEIPNAPAVRVAERYFDAEIALATMPLIIKREYARLRSAPNTANPAATTLPVGVMFSALGRYASALSDLHDAYLTLEDPPPGVPQAIDRQRLRITSMENCLQTFIHEWETFGGAPGSKRNDPRAHLPRSLRAAFCEP